MSIIEVVTLSLVGIITVFIILLIVWMIGIFLIFITNKLQKQTVDTVKATDNTSKKKIAAIVTAIKMITNGRGNITKIEKITNK